MFSPQGPNIPYYTLAVPANPILTGVRFYDQALAIHVTGGIETTVVDCFNF